MWATVLEVSEVQAAAADTAEWAVLHSRLSSSFCS